MDLLFAVFFIIIGVFGLFRYKFPKYDGSAEYAALLNLFLAFVSSIVFGLILFFII